MIKHIVWDFDGTLFNSYLVTINLFKSTLADFNISESFEDILKHFMISERTAISYYLDKYRLNQSFLNTYLNKKKDIDLSLITPFPFAIDTLKELNKLGISNYILTHRGSSTFKILKINNMNELFIEVITKNNGFSRKPHPESIYYLIDKYNINPNEMLIVGDRKLEVELGQNSNVKTCYFNSSNTKIDIIPNYHIGSLRDILKIVN